MPADNEQWPNWPLWAPFAAVLFGISAAILITGVVLGVVRTTGVHVGGSSPGTTIAATLAQDLCVVAAAVGVAALTTRPRPWHFGLRPASLKFASAIAFMGIASFFVFELVYSAVLHPKNPQKTVEDLGADRNTTLLICGALLVIVVAPVCEEIFFRGFLFRVLRNRVSFWIAAAIDGVLFGLVHGVNAAFPVLVVLGIILCWVYERSGTLFATIAIHATNNVIAYGGTTHHGWAAALPVGAVVLTACALLAEFFPYRRAPAPA
jgi:membrane protease YdiL (CAAX protease family)